MGSFPGETASITSNDGISFHYRVVAQLGISEDTRSSAHLGEVIHQSTPIHPGVATHFGTTIDRCTVEDPGVIKDDWITRHRSVAKNTCAIPDDGILTNGGVIENLCGLQNMCFTGDVRTPRDDATRNRRIVTNTVSLLNLQRYFAL